MHNMSHLFFGKLEDAAHSVHLDTDAKEFVKLVFVRYCRYSEGRLLDHIGAYGQLFGW